MLPSWRLDRFWAYEPEFAAQFDRYTCDGDAIETQCGDIRLVATIYHDDCGDRPDERDEGFWPSLDPNAAGYIGRKSKSTLARQMKRARETMKAWERDEWWYVGVAVRAFVDDIPLTGEFDHACWGIDCNYPSYYWRGRPRGWYPNMYLREVANDLASEAYAAALARIDTIKSAAVKIAKLNSLEKAQCAVLMNQQSPLSSEIADQERLPVSSPN